MMKSRSRNVAFLFVLAAALAIWVERSPAADPAKPSGAKNGPHAGAGDIYTLPKTDDVDDLFAFIQRLVQFEPDTPAAALEFRKRALGAFRAAAEKIVTLEKDPKSASAIRARTMLLSLQVGEADKATPAEQRKLVEEMRQVLAAGPSEETAELAMELATNLEYGDQAEAAGAAYRAFAKELGGSDLELPKEMGARMAGAARRLALVGKPLEISGTTVDGRPFDLKKYRGKVVLVDFWATWCKPCREELPNVLANYEKYHAQGFEVVGVSQDDDLPALKEFLAEQKLPWVTVLDHSDNADQPAISQVYGIFGIPATFLVDREGKVVTMKSRGPLLGEQLAKLCAPGAAPKGER